MLAKFCALIFYFSSCLGINAAVRIGIAIDPKYYGERELAWKIKLAAEQLGWEAFLDESEGLDLLTIPHLDWVICLTPKIRYTTPGCPNFIALFDDVRFHFDKEGKLLSFYDKYDGFLLTISQERFQQLLPNEKTEYFSVPFFPTVQDTPYQRVSLNRIATTMPVWGDRLRKKKYKGLYRLLSESGCVSFYGRQSRQLNIQQGYRGPLPFDGVSVINAFQKEGIVLVLHSDLHLQAKIPSARIFEAAAASAVIISDQNAFVQEHFGDTIYYIDVSLDSEEIYSQIMQCLKIIQQDPKAALQKAAKAHQIFEEKFLMTSQLLQLQKKVNETYHLPYDPTLLLSSVMP